MAQLFSLGVIATLSDMSKLQAPIITGLVISAVSGLTLLAYNNPDGYDMIRLWIMGIVGICVLIISLFTVGFSVAYILFVPIFQRDKFAEAEAILHRYCRPGLVFFSSAAILIFLVALHGLKYISPQKQVETKAAIIQTNLPSHNP